MKQFEYRKLTIIDHFDLENKLLIINEWGAQGWELVATTYPNNCTLIFKREKKMEENQN